MEVIPPIVDTVKLVRQDVPVRGNKDSAKMIQNWEKVILLISENFLWQRVGLDFFRFRLIKLVMNFYVLQHGLYVENNSVKTLFNMLPTSRLCRNISCFGQS